MSRPKPRTLAQLVEDAAIEGLMHSAKHYCRQTYPKRCAIGDCVEMTSGAVYRDDLRKAVPCCSACWERAIHRWMLAKRAQL